MSTRPLAWVLNLDAENELEAGPGYTPARHIQRIVARERKHLFGTLVAPGDVVVEAGSTGGEESARARGLPGLAWSPTPRARALLARAGAIPVAGPTLETLRTVNGRPFALEVRATLREDGFDKHLARNLEQALALLAQPAREGWLVRRTFGAAGRGRRRIASGRPSSTELAWLVKGLRKGALIIEPWVTITQEFTRSGWVARDGHVSSAAPCFQATTREGAWRRTECAERGAITRAEDARLEGAFFAAGRALAGAGYFGPFGIDSFRHRCGGPGSAELLNPLGEINPRFTMDWVAGMSADQGRKAIRAWWDPSGRYDSGGAVRA
ncbi:MAG: hypothetical protein CMJ89_15415 [Planctomycetes bacterium]|nr:hypothetical protein [Planctomycetota bacterium]